MSWGQLRDSAKGCSCAKRLPLVLEKGLAAYPCRIETHVHVEHMAPSLQARFKPACPSALSWLQLPLVLEFHFQH